MFLGLKNLSATSLKGKLILVFALVSLIPTVVLILVSYLIIAQGISRWEIMTNELNKLRILPMIENVRGIASDPHVIDGLKRNTEFAVDYNLPEGYVLAIYNKTGKLLFNSNAEALLYNKLASLENLGLPPVSHFPIVGPILPKEPIKLNNKEFTLVANACISEDYKTLLGIVIVGKIIPSAISDIKNMRRGIIAILGLVAVSIFLIALWISSLIAKEITEPINKLVLGTRELAGGNLDYIVDITTTDEVRILADSFNEMTERLRKNSEELKRIEKSAAWREVAQKLAHEIKNPLTPIQLSAERLKRRYYSKPEGYEQILNECTDTIVDEVERLRRLLDEFSQFARMPAIKPVLTDINGVIKDSIRFYGEYPENIELLSQYEDNLPYVMIDPDQTKRAFFNIIKNAVEAMPDGGKLMINTTIKEIETEQNIEKYVEIEFADTGTGMSKEDMSNLFTPHFSMKKGGAGLGLTIVKKIIDDQGGNIDVISEEGKGTNIVIRIPISEELNSAGR
ncbi:TPA: HAMP domain-containing protein [bacterium]|nr:HAMP domain-containing protein [bacterium]